MKTLTNIRHKLVSINDAVTIVRGWQGEQKRVVFTNGCFDILHEGHVTYLAQSADEGDKLIIGLNTDASVKRQGKGDDRPVNGELSRALILAALGFVDLIVLFDDNTPLELIKVLSPDVLVKGADYDANDTDESSAKYIVGSKEVRAHGGTVKAITLVQGFSTTAILNSIKK
jgi:rfaE bifunctional protein nucleotidyltransferase chain/domain